MNMPHKYPKTRHWPWSETVHRDDTIHVDPEFFVGKEVVVTEKLDGGNTCLFNGEVYARSVTGPSHDGWMAMVRKHHAYKSFQDDRTAYGEDLYGIHSIGYDALKENETWRLFAVRDVDTFVSWEQVKQIAELVYQVPTVPVKFEGVFESTEAITEFFKRMVSGPSELGPLCEGGVMRIVDRFYAKDFGLNVCKFVRLNHVATDQHWRRNWQPCKLIK